MKKLILVLAVVATTFSLNAQSIGIHAGLNFASGQFDDGLQEDDLKGITGIRIGPIVQVPMGTIFELHTGAIYSQKGYELTDAINLGKVNIDYIDIPINIAASFDLGGIGAYVKGGPVLGLGIGGKQTTALGEFDIEFGSEDNETKVLDIAGSVAAGIKFGTLQLEAGYNFSLSDLSNIEAGYKNQVIHVGLSFVVGR